MKRTQTSVIVGLLAFSLAACSYMPWRNTSGTSPSALPSAGSAPASSVPSASNAAGSAGTTTATNNTGASEPTGKN